MKRFLALLHARNLEFLRDRAALIWALLFPAFLILGCVLIFAGGAQPLFHIGTLQQAPLAAPPSLLAAPYVRVHGYDDREQALTRLRHHQLDLLLGRDADGRPAYWVNPLSERGEAVERLLGTEAAPLQRHAVAGRAVRYVDWALPGILAMNMMFAALFGVGYVVVRYRINGVLKRLQATPASALEFLAAQIGSRLLVTLSTNALIFAGCLWLLDLLMLGRYRDLLAVGLLGGLAMISLGLLISSRTDSEEFAGGMLNLCTWPMMFLSEVWFSLDNAPTWLQLFSQLLPLTHLVAAARAVMIDGAGLAAIGHHLLALGASAAALLALAAALFRWHRD